MAKSTAAVVREEKKTASPAKGTAKAGAAEGVAVMNPVAGFLAGTTSFLHDVRGEMRKVVTPSKEEVRTTTTVVLVTVFAFAAYFYLVDAVLSRTVQALLRWLGGTQ